MTVTYRARAPSDGRRHPQEALVQLTETEPSFLATRRGKLTLALLCGVAFLDFVDASITNIALPSMRRSLHFSVEGLQWVPSGYLLTYGGFMLLGGRAADLLGRRRVLVSGIVLIGIASLVGGLAHSTGVLIGARLGQGLGAAFMLPAALSILTTTFKERKDRHTALGVWGGVGGLASAAGVLLGGVLRRGVRLALGDVRQPDRVRHRPRRSLPPDSRVVAVSDSAARFDFARRVPRDERNAASRLRAREGADRRMGRRDDDRRDRRIARAPRRVRRQRRRDNATRSRRSPSSASTGSRFVERDAARRVRRIPRALLLHHAVHAERARLLADPDRARVSTALRRDRRSRQVSRRSSCPASGRDL